MLSTALIFDTYGPQLGELVWHSLHFDDRIRTVSERHGECILNLIKKFRIHPSGRPVRILEIGAYAHYGAYIAASQLGGISAVHDISPTSLRLGQKEARRAGIDIEATLVAGDFHDLPFNTAYFDCVFCASSVHHTRHPRRMLMEALRSVRLGGILHLENEPVARMLCFYGFRSNRNEEFTPFERKLAERGSLFTFSSPFPGSRSESLFGMVENERVPLDLFLDTLFLEGRIESIALYPRITDFDRRILALPSDNELESRLSELLLREVEEVRPSLTDQDLHLGARLPTADDVWRLSYIVAPHLRRLTDLHSPELEREMARIFGAALRITVVKTKHKTRADVMLSRPLPCEDGVYDDLPKLSGLRLGLEERLIPAIADGDSVALSRTYPRDHWELCREASGLLSMLNLRSCCQIELPQLPTSTLLLLRFYAMKAPHPYRVLLASPDGDEIAAVIVAQSESLLLRELIPTEWTRVLIKTSDLDNEPWELPRHVRLGVTRLIPVRMNNL